MVFQISIQAKNITLGDRLSEYVESRIQKLERYIEGIMDVKVDLQFNETLRNADERYVAQITMRGKKFILRTEERAEDITAAFDAALYNLHRRIKKYKGKKYRGRGDSQTINEEIMDLFFNEEDFMVEEDEPRGIVRRKKFPLRPMDEQEAVLQMELLEHNDFFVFYNAATNSVNVLYSRRDGSLGLIETDV